MNKGADCYYCKHYYARTFDAGKQAVRLDGCILASKTLRRHPGKRVAETCPDYSPATLETK